MTHPTTKHETTVRGTLMLPAETTTSMPPYPAGSVRLARGEIRFRDSIITDILIDPDAPLDPTTIICPGFVDAHLHLPQFDSIGEDGLTLLEWLNTIIFPAEMRWEDEAYAAAMSRRVAARLLSAGTTSICAYATVHHHAARAAMRELSAAGLSGFVGQVLMDSHAPRELVRPAAQLIDEAASLKTVGNGGDSSRGTIAPIVSPRFALMCSMDLMRSAAELAHRRSQPIQTHLSEMLPECVRLRELYDGMDYVEVYHRAGLVTDRTVFAHAVWLNEAEHRRLAAHGATVAHCPTANTFLSSGAMDARTFHSGVKFALGSDIAGGPDVCMVRVARAMLENAKRIRPPFVPVAAKDTTADSPLPSAAACWWQITGGNAAVLGLGKVGRLERGFRADIVTLTPPTPFTHASHGEHRHWTSAHDPLAALLYAFDERWITQTHAGGCPTLHGR